MRVGIEPMALEVVRAAIARHLQENLSAPIESFLEDHIVAASHYHLLIDGAIAGIASVFESTRLVQFIVLSPFYGVATQLFAAALKLESVETAFVPTCDELYLSCALDASEKVEKQAYYWQAGDGVISAENLTLVPATPADQPFILDQTGDFFGDLPALIEHSNLYIGIRNDQPVGFGLIEPSRFYPATGSIGMFTIEQHRQQNIGTNLIRALIHECRCRNLRPVAGCYYHNYASRNTLLKAGMYSQTRLLRIYF